MKITLTLPEARNIIRESIRGRATATEVASPLEVEIVGDLIDRDATRPEFPLFDALRVVKTYRYKCEQKIAAIKALREFAATHGVSITLVQAKSFVESL